jgi:hypothetical protein
MKFPQFQSMVCRFVEKVADAPLVDVDPEFNLAPYFDDGADPEEQVSSAQSCANRVLFENGFVEEEE